MNRRSFIQSIAAAAAALRFTKPEAFEVPAVPLPKKPGAGYGIIGGIAIPVEASRQRRVEYCYGIDGQCTGMVIFDE